MTLRKPSLKPLFYIPVSLLILLGLFKVLSCFFIFQFTESLPKGIYFIEHGKVLTYGSLVIFPPPENVKGLLVERGWVPERLIKNFFFMKPIVAIQGDKVEVSYQGCFINGRYFGPVDKYDSKGRPLQNLDRVFVLGPDEYFVGVQQYHKSFDSRYFGTIRGSQIKGTVRPFLLF